MSGPPDLGDEPRPLPLGIRSTWMPTWDEAHGGLLPGELVVIASADLALGRDLALAWLAGLLRAMGPRGRACWYRTGPAWSPGEHAAKARLALGALVGQVELAGHSAAPQESRERVQAVTKRIRDWADGAGTRPPVAAVVVDAVPMLASGPRRGEFLHGLARYLDCPVLVLDTLTRRGRPASVVADAADYVLVLTDAGIETRPTRRGPAGFLPWP